MVNGVHDFAEISFSSCRVVLLVDVCKSVEGSHMQLYANVKDSV